MASNVKRTEVSGLPAGDVGYTSKFSGETYRHRHSDSGKVLANIKHADLRFPTPFLAISRKRSVFGIHVGTLIVHGNTFLAEERKVGHKR